MNQPRITMTSFPSKSDKPEEAIRKLTEAIYTLLKIDEDKERRIRKLELELSKVSTRSSIENSLGVRWKSVALTDGTNRLDFQYRNDSGDWVSAGGFAPP